MNLAPSTPPPAHGGPGALRAGLALAARYPQLLLVTWAVNLLAALLLALLPALTLAAGPGDRPVLRDMADGIDAWLWIEATMSPQAEMQLQEISPDADLSIGLGPVVLWTLLALLALPLLGWLAGAFVQGGILATYRDAPRPFGWRRFLRAGWRWWGAFLLLGVAQGLAASLFLLPLIAGAVVAFGAGSPALGWLLVVLALGVNLLGLALFESTRVLTVAAGTRNAFRYLGAAARLMVRHPLPLALLYLLTLAAAALLQGIYRLGLRPIVPLDAWLPVLVAAQMFLAARVALRLGRLAGVSALVGGPQRMGNQTEG